jgi:parallel beta-helix repeat protein
MKKLLSIGIIILFLGLSLSSTPGFIEEQSRTKQYGGNTLYVGGLGPGNYTKIQDAIDDASDGDTVFVYDDSSPYNEWLSVKSTINLIGENRNTTIIDTYTENCTVNIYADKVNITGFTIRNRKNYSGSPGIYINSNNNTIEDNNMDLHMPTAIYIYNSNNNIITRNYISNCDGGITLYKYSTNNIISNNYFFNAGLIIKNSYHNIVLNNTIKDKPIVYLEDEENSEINVDAGQIILINCDNITIKNQDLCHTSYGIELWQTHNCHIINNNISNNWKGIYQYSSKNNTIRNNTIYSNNYNGIQIQSSNNNTINDNIIISNDGNGIFSEDSLFDTIIANNNISSNNEAGIWLRRSSSKNTITGNTINSNSAQGICVSGSNIIIGNSINSNKGTGILIDDGNTVRDNYISKNKNGIGLTFSHKNIIDRNNLSNNGISIYRSKKNIISNNSIFKGGLSILSTYQWSNQNTIFNNTVNDKPLIYLENESNIDIDLAGQIILRSCDNITIQNQDLSNTSVGINLLNTTNCTISNNAIISCSKESIKFEDSAHNILIDNTIQKSLLGIEFRYSDNNAIINNEIISHNEYGVRIYHSDIINIIGNKITSNKEYGIHFKKSYYSTISDNTIISDNWDGIRIESCINNTIVNNTVISNSGMGLQVYHSNKNIIMFNNISSNKNLGLEHWSSNSNNIFDTNICGNNEFHWSILIHDSNNNTFTGNYISDGEVLIYRSTSNNILENDFLDAGFKVMHSYQNNFLNNTVKDKPIVYLEDDENSEINIDAGQIILINCDNITIKNQELCHTSYGIELWQTHNCYIIDNNISNNRDGIYQYSSKNNNIKGNTISSNKENGISFSGDSDSNTITNNTISSNKGKGISFNGDSNSNTISANNILNNNNGLYFSAYDNNHNIIIHNNFINNTHNVIDEYYNTWNGGQYGNYWDDYEDRYPDAKKKRLKGIWDTPYDIPGGDFYNKDFYPLLKQWPDPVSKISQNNQNVWIQRWLDRFPILNQLITRIMGRWSI